MPSVVRDAAAKGAHRMFGQKEFLSSPHSLISDPSARALLDSNAANSPTIGANTVHSPAGRQRFLHFQIAI